MKPILATDAQLPLVEYPVLGLPKIDGVRALNIDGKLVGRSGKQFKNKRNTQFFSDARFTGFDGEMVAGGATDDGLCNTTTSAMTTIEGEVDCVWHLFDYVIDGQNDKAPYFERYMQLFNKVNDLYRQDPLLMRRICLVPYENLSNESEVLNYEEQCLAQGYEGIILRKTKGHYKYGRSTAKEGIFLRVKTFMDSEILVTQVLEGKSNQNELRANPHGYAERSTHAENMVNNGMVGTIIGTALEDVHFQNRVIISKGQTVEVSPGKMNHDARRTLFNDQSLIVGKIIKYQFFPIGIKDKPRFPTFQSFRDLVDL